MEGEGSVSSIVLYLAIVSYPSQRRGLIATMNACISAQRVHAWTALTSTVSANSYPSAIERSLMHLSLRYSRTTCSKCKLFLLFTNKPSRFIRVV